MKSVIKYILTFVIGVLIVSSVGGLIAELDPDIGGIPNVILALLLFAIAFGLPYFVLDTFLNRDNNKSHVEDIEQEINDLDIITVKDKIEFENDIKSEQEDIKIKNEYKVNAEILSMKNINSYLKEATETMDLSRKLGNEEKILKEFVKIYTNVFFKELYNSNSGLPEDAARTLFKMTNLTTIFKFSSSEIEQIIEKYNTNVPFLITIMYIRIRKSNRDLRLYFILYQKGLYNMIKSMFNKCCPENEEHKLSLV